jgi:hypothetical protein
LARREESGKFRTGSYKRCKIELNSVFFIRREGDGLDNVGIEAEDELALAVDRSEVLHIGCDRLERKDRGLG